MRAPQREREGPPSFRCASIAMEGRGVPVAPVSIVHRVPGSESLSGVSAAILAGGAGWCVCVCAGSNRTKSQNTLPDRITDTVIV